MVCEATGGYERGLMKFLFEKGVAVRLVNPARVRAFARSEGIQAKTDAIDAQVLLRFAQEKQLRAQAVPEASRVRLSALLDRRSQLSEQLAREKNRSQKSDSDEVSESIQVMISFVQQQIESIDEKIEECIDQNTTMKEQYARMIEVKGVGTVTAWSLLAYLPEMTHVGRNQAVALAGIAPYNRDSGKHSAKRKIVAGRAKVRRCLYMATQSAAVHNPIIKAYVQGLRARGKPYKCAIVAGMRKLLIHLQSLLKNPQLSLA